MRSTQQIFKDTQGVVERLFDYHLTHDMNEHGQVSGVFRAIESTMQDVLELDVSEEVMTLHMRRLRHMMNV